MSKCHLIDVDEPLDRGKCYIARCGVCIEHAAFEFVFDVGAHTWKEVIDSVNRLTTCAKCLAGEIAGRYIYGIREAEMERKDEAA